MTRMMSDWLLKKFNEVEKKHWWWEGRRELLKLLTANENPKKILDVGCGTGETLSFVKTIFPKAKLYGIDTSRRAIKYSRQRGHKNILYSKAEDLPFKKNTFDLIMFLDVLEHIEEDQLAINEASRVLKKKGIIVITSPGLNLIWSNHDVEQGHKRRYTRKRIKLLAERSGLNIRFISYFNFFLSPPIILIRLLSNVKPFYSFSSYDNGINYDIVNVGLVNSILKKIFIFEIKMLRYVKYIFGISIVAVLEK